MAEKEYLERTMEQTPTWAIAVVCFVLLAISILIEQGIHHIGAWLKSKHKRALFEALEKIKAELMLLGFLSLLLVILKRPIASICISKKAGDSWHPCSKDPEYEAKTKEEDKCMKVIMKWKAWEDETKTMEYQYSHDPQRFRFARETSFGRRHLNSWSRSSVLLWIVSFFRQFFKSVDKVDYLALRHGFIVAHLAPGSETNFDFLKYISRSLEEDFVVVVGISPTIWFSAVLFLLSNTRGWYAYFWLPFIPLIIILLVGAKLLVIITKMGLRIHERGDVVRGTPVVELGDDLFWFNNPRFILFLINLVLFQNAFQLAFFAWSTYEFGLRTCFHQHLEDIIIRISMGVIIHFLCSYVTLPLYALVTQMGSTMKPTIFNDGVATALKHWHHTAKEHTKHHHGGQRSEGGTPCSSAPTTPTHSMSPVHLLHNYRRSDSLLTSPKKSNFVNAHWDDEGSTNRFHHGGMDNEQYNGQSEPKEEAPQTRVPAGSAQLPPGPRPTRAQHEIDINSSEFSFRKRDHRLDRTG